MAKTKKIADIYIPNHGVFSLVGAGDTVYLIFNKHLNK